MTAVKKLAASLGVALAMILTLSLVAAGPAGASTTTQSARQAAHRHRVHKVHHALRIARHKKGDPYSYGADGPHRFDCSGLTYFAFHKRSGFRHFPRTAAAQAHFANRIRRGHMRKGDLIFFTGSGGVYHVGIFDGWRHGHRLVLHAPYPGQRVRVQRLWTNAWFPGTLRHH